MWQLMIARRVGFLQLFFGCETKTAWEIKKNRFATSLIPGATLLTMRICMPVMLGLKIRAGIFVRPFPLP